MRIAQLHAVKSPLVLAAREPLTAGSGEVVVRLRRAALNRRDYWITQGLYPGLQLPVVLGSDGAGEVVAAGEGVDPACLGQPVVIHPGCDWGGDEAVQAAEFSILGMPRDGTLADEILVPREQIFPKPAHLNWSQAGALPLAGLTAYRALFTRGQLRAGQQVLITGLGGGVATMAVQMARAAGARVFVTSGSNAKLDQAAALGVTGAANYRNSGWAKDLLKQYGAMHLIIDGAGGNGYPDLIQLAAPGGRIVSYGATAGPAPAIDLFKVFWKQLGLLGSTMGSPADFAAMLQFVERNQVVPVIDSETPLEGVNQALSRLGDSEHLGKIVIQLA